MPRQEEKSKIPAKKSKRSSYFSQDHKGVYRSAARGEQPRGTAI